MKKIANGVELFYQKTGEGTPLILLHGNGEDHKIFHPLMKELENYFTIYAIDSRNHGQSEMTDTYSYQTMADDITAFIQLLGLTDVNILGFSDGGIIALLMAMDPKVPLHKIVTLGANMSPSDFKDEILADIQKGYEEHPNPLLKLMLEEPQITVDDLAKITIPVFVIQGEDDIYKSEVADTIYESLQMAQKKIILGHSHSSYIENNDMLSKDVLTFLEK